LTQHHKLTGRALARQIDLDLRPFGLTAALPAEIPAARDLAAALIGPAIASAQGLARVHAHAPAVFVAREADRVSGVLAFVVLNAAGLAAVLGAGFDTVEPDLAHLASPDEAAAGVYGWGVCAADKPAAERVVGACKRLHAGALAALPQFARTATDAGRRLMYQRLGFVDLPDSGGLVWAPPRAQPAEAA
jgi:hypothetical protein